jgi:hypothetical protein
MKKVASIALLLVVIIAVAALAVPTASAKRPPSEPTCLCPDIFDPVFCTSDGQTYSNFCQAGCAGATGCTRTGDI